MVWKIQRCLPVFASKARMWPGEPGRVSGTVLPMMSMSSKITPGLLALMVMLFGRTVQSFAQIDAAVVAEGLNRFAGLAVEGP